MLIHLLVFSGRWIPQPSQPEKRFAEAGAAHGSLAKRPKPNRPGLVVDTQNYSNNGYDNLSAFSDSTNQEMTPMSGLTGHPTRPGVRSVSPTQSPRNKTRPRSKAHVKEPQMFPCQWEGCTHPEFTRACDLT